MEEERCENCKFCHELYTPPTKTTKAKHEYCCTLFLDENQVTVIGNNVYDMCECFTEKE